MSEIVDLVTEEETLLKFKRNVGSGEEAEYGVQVVQMFSYIFGEDDDVVYVQEGELTFDRSEDNVNGSLKL